MNAATKPAVQSGGAAVMRMRDEFLQLVTAWNAMGNYSSAADAQAMAIALNKFEDDHNITSIEWPPRVAEDEHGKWLAEIES